MYVYDLTKEARDDIAKLKKSSPTDYKKVVKFLNEIMVDPRVGTGHPEQLKGCEGEIWSRAINKKDRLVYEIYEERVLVLIVSAIGHY